LGITNTFSPVFSPPLPPAAADDELPVEPPADEAADEDEELLDELLDEPHAARLSDSSAGLDWKRSSALPVGVQGSPAFLRLSPSEQNEQTRSNQIMFVAVKLPLC
jgi:hypothetical protein